MGVGSGVGLRGVTGIVVWGGMTGCGISRGKVGDVWERVG